MTVPATSVQPVTATGWSYMKSTIHIVLAALPIGQASPEAGLGLPAPLHGRVGRGLDDFRCGDVRAVDIALDAKVQVRGRPRPVMAPRPCRALEPRPAWRHRCSRP